MKSFEQIPFNPARWPFFYGWMILFWGVLGIILSVPGQTTGVSAFIEPLIRDLGIDRFQLSTAYLIGTLSSSFLLTPAGKLFDRVGARWMGCASCATLGLVLILLSQIDHIAIGLSKCMPKTAALVTLLSFLFFTLRLSGQGVLTMASRNMIMKWFNHHRGLASGISGAAVSFGFAYTPTVFSGMIGAHGWSGTWLLLGLFLLFIFAPLLLTFFRDTPEASGLIPDGKIIASTDVRERKLRQYTLAEARRTFDFWAFTLTMALQALALTAVTFHIESIFDHAGLEGSRGFAVFPPTAYVSILVTLLGGWLSDRAPLRWFLTAMLATMGINLIGLINLSEGWPIACMIFGGGIANGLFGILMSVTWPRYYGREHLGAISGLCMTFMVIFSAAGPALFSALLKWSGGYQSSLTVCLIAAAVLFIGSFRVRNPQLH